MRRHGLADITVFRHVCLVFESNSKPFDVLFDLSRDACAFLSRKAIPTCFEVKVFCRLDCNSISYNVKGECILNSFG